MSRLPPLLWGLAIVLGAAFIRFGRPQDHSPLLALAIDSEAFHVAAHLALYGTLAWLCSRRSGRPLAWLGLVLAIGAVQELTQVGGLRSPGPPELFDLAVDALAASLVAFGPFRASFPPT